MCEALLAAVDTEGKKRHAANRRTIEHLYQRAFLLDEMSSMRKRESNNECLCSCLCCDVVSACIIDRFVYVNKQRMSQAKEEEERISRAKLYILHAKRQVRSKYLVRRLFEIEQILSPLLPEGGMMELLNNCRQQNLCGSQPKWTPIDVPQVYEASPPSDPEVEESPETSRPPPGPRGKCFSRKGANGDVQYRKMDRDIKGSKRWRLRPRKKWFRQTWMGTSWKDKYKGDRVQKNKIKQAWKRRRAEKAM